MGLNPQGFLLSVSTLFPVWSHVASRVNVFLLHRNDFYILVSSVDSPNVQNGMSSIRANISHGSVIEPMNLTCPTLRSSPPLVVTLVFKPKTLGAIIFFSVFNQKISSIKNYLELCHFLVPPPLASCSKPASHLPNSTLDQLLLFHYPLSARQQQKSIVKRYITLH